MQRHLKALLVVIASALIGIPLGWISLEALAADAATGRSPVTKVDSQNLAHAQRALAEGKHTFRFDTFGDEAFWGDTIRLHEAIAGTRFGGVGPGLSPKAAVT